MNRNGAEDSCRGRMEVLLTVGVVLVAAAQIVFTFANRALDRVAGDVAAPSVGIDFWRNLPPDVQALDFQIEQQVALLEEKLGGLECELQPPGNSSRTRWEQARMNDRVESAIAGPVKVIRRLQSLRAERIRELKERYLAGLGLQQDS